ncbi:ABC transporter ATP-binding protein [Nocardioides sp. TRM66260-LWL]|uniref:ABC transporter ATP-binding protein n=1 Tax=Nocardioides sp. TRM66260-LWL TaxID=2874478 RepID=UPI001CC3DFD0|nr:ABC transporter ATP-binding protein [Nocardioides sp. TRM66260-LWL]MBZ5736362.1 ABC transporter ATP-binding protein [Nocardioides sp. TRM66260-LWL]
MSDPLLSVRDLKVSFPSEAGRVDAVRGVSFDLHPGKTLGIVGESGSGKSVTSLAVMGLLSESARVEGSVRLGGRELLGLSDKDMSGIRGKDVAMVFQDPLSSLTPVFPIGRQIVEAIRIHQDVSPKAAADRAIDLLRLVGIPRPETRLKAFPHEFSGGMRQRVMIAMAMANDPKLIIADEPTTALDVTIQAQILEVLKTAQAETGAAVIMITHDLGVVAGSADDVLVMYAGRAVETAPVNEAFYAPRMPYTIGLLEAIPRVDTPRGRPLVPIAGNPPLLIDLPPGCPYVARCPIAIDACREKEPDLLPVASDLGARVVAEVGEVPGQDSDLDHRAACIRAHEIADRRIGGQPVYPVPEVPENRLAAVPREERPTVLEARNLRKEFPLVRGAVLKRKVGTVHAVDGVSFDIRQGETLAIVGESGSGKTTTLLEIMNLSAPEGGDLIVGGVSTASLSKAREQRALRRDLQMVFQDPASAIDPRLTVFDIIAEPMQAIGTPKDEVDARVSELMELVGLDPAQIDRFPAAFSGGQRQRIGIARALSTNPKVVVLDEPVSALDVSIQAGVINLLDELKAKLGLSYLFVAHDLSVVRHLADRVAVMYLGAFVEHGDVDTVFDDPRHPYTQALISAIPLPDPIKERTRERVVLRGDLPSPTDQATGCRFVSRCPLHLTLDSSQQQKCREVVPELTRGSDQADHLHACHFR